MKGFLDFIKKYWGIFIDITRRPLFIFSFPLFVFGVLYVAVKSNLMLIPILIWIVVMVSNSETHVAK